VTKKTRILIAVFTLALAAFAVAWWNYYGASENDSGADDARNLEVVRAASESGPPPVKFNDLPAKPPSGAREPLD
jgi:hypothetical protein